MDINQDALAKAVGRAIAYQRQQRGMTQEEVAERLQIGMEAVSRMERGLWFRLSCDWLSWHRYLDVS